MPKPMTQNNYDKIVTANDTKTVAEEIQQMIFEKT